MVVVMLIVPTMQIAGAWVLALRPKRCLLAATAGCVTWLRVNEADEVAETDVGVAEDPLSQQREYARVHE